MNLASRCRSCIAMLMAGLFSLSHGATARPRVLAVERCKVTRTVAGGRPRLGWER